MILEGDSSGTTLLRCVMRRILITPIKELLRACENSVIKKSSDFGESTGLQTLRLHEYESASTRTIRGRLQIQVRCKRKGRWGDLHIGSQCKVCYFPKSERQKFLLTERVESNFHLSSSTNARQHFAHEFQTDSWIEQRTMMSTAS